MVHVENGGRGTVEANASPNQGRSGDSSRLTISPEIWLGVSAATKLYPSRDARLLAAKNGAAAEPTNADEHWRTTETRCPRQATTGQRSRVRQAKRVRTTAAWATSASCLKSPADDRDESPPPRECWREAWRLSAAPRLLEQVKSSPQQAGRPQSPHRRQAAPFQWQGQ